MATQPPPPSAPPFEIGSFALSPRFPAVRLPDAAAFRQYLNQEQGRLDARYTYEQSLASSEPEIRQSGTCAPCLRPATYTSATAGGTPGAGGRLVPNWRESLICDCRDQLNNRQRAMLHFVQATGILPWARLLLAGPPAAVDTRLASLAASMEVMRPFGSPPASEGFHMAISHDYLQHVPRLDAALVALRAQLLDGGRFVFTVPFHHDLEASERLGGESPEPPHKFGWDLLDRLRQAGFRDAAAYLYWSEELGYLGPMNFIFRAVK
jgi:hypothetical protein